MNHQRPSHPTNPQVALPPGTALFNDSDGSAASDTMHTSQTSEKSTDPPSDSSSEGSLTQSPTEPKSGRKAATSKAATTKPPEIKSFTEVQNEKQWRLSATCFERVSETASNTARTLALERKT
ncbi:hypothetical protein FI667_g3459, partial [Globisporangium splendens]